MNYRIKVDIGWTDLGWLLFGGFNLGAGVAIGLYAMGVAL